MLFQSLIERFVMTVVTLSLVFDCYFADILRDINFFLICLILKVSILSVTYVCLKIFIKIQLLFSLQ